MKKFILVMSVTVISLIGTGLYAQLSFDPPQTLSGPGAASAVVSADVNGDGFKDLVVGVNNGGSGVILVYFNDQQGGFRYPVDILLAQPVSKVVAGDFNGDGFVDLVAVLGGPMESYSGKIMVFLNDHQLPGNFLPPNTVDLGEPIYTIKPIDVDQDGTLDLVGVNAQPLDFRFLVIQNDGQGDFAVTSTLPLGSLVIDLEVADIDGDGMDDVVAAYQYYDQIDVADALVFTNVGDGSFDKSAKLLAGANTSAVRVGDFNNDGHPDIVLLDYNNTVLHLFENNGAGLFSTYTDIPASGNGYSMDAGDFDGDGLDDIVALEMQQQQLEFFINSTASAGNFTPTGIALSVLATAITNSDLNNDGLPDLIIFSPLAPGVYVIMNSTTVLPVDLKAFEAQWRSGHAELVWNSGVESELAYYGVQRSTDGKDFEEIAQVAPKGSGSSYSYQDRQTAPVAYYRLALRFLDGHTEYSDIQSVESRTVGSDNVVLYPNPAVDRIFLSVRQAGQYSVFDNSGRLLKKVELNAGRQGIDIRSLAAGIYYLSGPDGKFRFIKKYRL